MVEKKDMVKNKPRWHYRFENYKRAFTLLREAIYQKRDKGELSDLEEEGVIQRFEYTWELAWKTLKDFLENEGVSLEKITPKAVIVAAIEAKIISEHEHWMQALDDRNKITHTYSRDLFSKILVNIDTSHIEILEQLYHRLYEEFMENQ